jgi:hypothetical protein
VTRPADAPVLFPGCLSGVVILVSGLDDAPGGPAAGHPPLTSIHANRLCVEYVFLRTEYDT